MVRLVFGMNQSLDGYVDHMAFGPGPTLFRSIGPFVHVEADTVTGAVRPESEIDRAARAWAFVRTPKTSCDTKPVDLAYDRLHNATGIARMYRVRIRKRVWPSSCSE